MKFLLTILAVALCIGNALSFTKKDLYEGKCPSGLTPAKNLDMDWVQKPGTWYFPLMGRLHATLMAMEIGKQKLNEVDDEDMDKACWTLKWKGLDATVSFRGKSSVYPVKPQADGSVLFDMPIEGGRNMKFVNTLTDNKDFLLYTICDENNERTFVVASKSKVLSPEDKKAIVTHLVELGYDYRFFEEADYDQCESKDEL